MKELLRKWLGIDDIEYRVNHLEHPLPTGKPVADAIKEQDIKNALGVLGGLLEHFDLDVRKVFVPDESVMWPPPDRPVRETFKVYPRKVVDAPKGEA